jgi:hypothetical protein
MPRAVAEPRVFWEEEMLKLRFATAVAVAALSLLSTGCATMYVDKGLKDVTQSEYMKPPELKPVQLLFNFQTKGAANARATKFLGEEVTKTVTASGLFSSVSPDPVPGGALLSITLNNVPITDNAFAKGFATGLTFGLAGSQVSDGYVCTIDYLPGAGSAQMQKKLRHAIHTTVGAKGAPDNGVKARNPTEAVQTMTRQVVGNGLKELSLDPGFIR